MKKLIALMALTTLVACNGNSSSSKNKSGNPVTDFPTLTPDTLTLEQKKEVAALIQKNSPVTRPGLSKITEFTGKDLDYDTLARTGKVNFIDDNEVQTEIVLKVEGADVYSYSIQEDRAKGEKSVSISIDTEDETDLDELAESNMSINGDELIFSKEMHDDESEVKVSSIFKGIISISNPCNMKIDIGIKTFTAPTEVGPVQVPAFTRKLQASCGKIYSSAELKALDLSNISVCDHRADNDVYCETKDMSHLTNEL